MGRKSYTCIESFSGCGGLALGLRRAGFELRAAFDFDELAVRTYNRNLGDECFVADARQLTGTELLKRARLDPGGCDLFSGGPPCQVLHARKRRSIRKEARV